MYSGCPYDFVPPREDARLNPRRRALEDYGLRPDVHEPIFRFLTDILQAQPKDAAGYMLKWATAEKKNPDRISTAFRMDMTNDKYNLKVELHETKPKDEKSKSTKLKTTA